MLGRTYPVYTGCGEEDSLKQFIRNSPQPEAEAHSSLAYLYKKVIAITKQHLLECGIVCSYYMTEAQHSGEWKQDDPYKLADRDFEIKYTASCMCGEVEYAVNSDPVSAKYCHCTDCQRLHG